MRGPGDSGAASPLRGEGLSDRREWTWQRLAEVARVGVRNWWARAFGRGKAFDEGRDLALTNAAMLAYDMGRPDIRHAINRLMPKDSPYRPVDCDTQSRAERDVKESEVPHV